MYQQFFDRFILPLFGASTVARTLAKKRPDVAADLLKRMKPSKAVAVLNFWSTGVRTIILREMGEKVIRLLKLMSLEDRARMFVTLNPRVIKKYSTEIKQDDVVQMRDYWSESDLKTVMMRLNPTLAIALLEMLEDDEKVIVLGDLKPWIQASLLEKLANSSKAAVVENLEFSQSIDLITRWDSRIQAEILPLVSPTRQQEIYRVLSPKIISLILENYNVDKAREILLNLDEERQRHTFYRFHMDLQTALFPDLLEDMQVLVLNGIEPVHAIKLLRTVPKKVNNSLMNKIDEDQAAGIRMAALMG